MATQTLNELADALLDTIDEEKKAELSKTASASHNIAVSTEVGAAMLKVAETVRNMASQEITMDDVTEFRKRYGI